MDVSAVPLAVVPLKAEGSAPLLARDGSALTGAAAAAEAADIAAALEAEQQDAELVPLFPDFPPAARAKLRAFGKATWKGLTEFTLFFSVFLMWHLIHQARGACCAWSCTLRTLTVPTPGRIRSCTPMPLGAICKSA